MNLSLPRISHDPARRGGRACVRDLRISVGDVLGWLASGMTIDQVLSEYPELSIDDIRECLAYAAVSIGNLHRRYQPRCSDVIRIDSPRSKPRITRVFAVNAFH